MGNMAEEMAARIAAEEGGDSGAAAPGTGAQGGQTTPQPDSSAGTQTTETAQGEPGPIPYSRFKEVNDKLAALRPYEELQQWGYDPDSLGRLANFDYAFRVDPSGTTAQLVDNLDLPDEAKTQIRDLLGIDGSGESGQGEGTPSTQPSGDEPPAWAAELIEDKRKREQREQEYLQTQEAEQQAQAMDAMLADTIAKWDELDKRDGVQTAEAVKLSHIASHAASGRYRTIDELVESARADRLQQRDLDLGSAVQRIGGQRVSVPSGSALPTSAQVPRTMAEANKMAKAAIESGNLPPVTPGE